MNKKWLFGLISASALVAGLVACGSGDILEPGEDDAMLLEAAEESPLVNNTLKPNVSTANAEYDAYCANGGKCENLSNGNGGSSVPASSSSAAQDPGTTTNPGSTTTPGGSTTPGSSVTPGGSTTPGSTVTPGGSTTPGSTVTPGGSTTPGGTVTPGGSSTTDPGTTTDPGSTTPIPTPEISSSSTTPITPVESSSSVVTPPESSSSTPSGGDGDSDISLGTAKTISAGTYTLTDCNGSTGSKTLQLGGGSSDDCLEWFGVSGWGSGPWGTCSGQIAITLPLEITVPDGGNVQVGSCW